MGNAFSNVEIQNYEKKRPGINSYGISDKGVYWKGIKIYGINPDKFIAIKNGYGYGVDDIFIYYKGNRIGKNIGFYVLSNGYAKDLKNVYYNGNIITNADPRTFRSLKTIGYATDKYNKFFKGIIIY
jgi:hypothetical protein